MRLWTIWKSKFSVHFGFWLSIQTIVWFFLSSQFLDGERVKQMNFQSCLLQGRSAISKPSFRSASQLWLNWIKYGNCRWFIAVLSSGHQAVCPCKQHLRCLISSSAQPHSCVFLSLFFQFQSTFALDKSLPTDLHAPLLPFAICSTLHFPNSLFTLWKPILLQHTDAPVKT